MHYWSRVKCFTGSNPDVKKFVFETEDAVAEAVLYKYGSYEKRTVLCVSTQSGCPVGCIFCGTGKKFIRNLSYDEIIEQVEYILSLVEEEVPNINGRCNKLQIMFMSMGEPMLNWPNVSIAINNLATTYRNAYLLVSTMGVDDKSTFKEIVLLGSNIYMMGLQFSVHSLDDTSRNAIIPMKGKFSLRDIRDAGIHWYAHTHRQCYLNFCVNNDSKLEDFHRILELFSPEVFALTFSVICETEHKEAKQPLEFINNLVHFFTNEYGYNTRMFDPAGQDDIGGGCGQLWYVQEWMKNKS